MIESDRGFDRSFVQVMIAKEGVPSFYIKLLANLEDLLLATLKDKPAVKKMSATNTRSLNRMKLQLRKHNKGCVREIATRMKRVLTVLSKDGHHYCIGILRGLLCP